MTYTARTLRNLVLGRVNWLFFGSEEGAKNSTILMSLVQSCKELGISPLFYLRDVLQQITRVPATQVHTLTPKSYKDNPGAAAREERSRRDLAATVASLEFAPP